jgi:putative endonuclease
VPATYYVYILTNHLGTSLYTGVTNDLIRRVIEHRQRKPGSYSARYKTTRLIYYEETGDVSAAIQREKQIKGWARKKKLDLIATLNRRWDDLSKDWFESPEADLGLRDSSLRSE